MSLVPTWFWVWSTRFALCAALLGAPAFAQSVLCEVRPNRAFAGQDIQYFVQVRGTKQASCEVGAIAGLRLELTDEGVTNQSTHLTVINGRREMRESADYVFVYRVTAEQPGRYDIPAPQVSVDGASFTGSRCTLVIEDPSLDDRAAIELRCEPSQVVLGENAELIVDVFLKHLPSELRVRDPLDLFDKSESFSLFDRGTPPPQLSLPWISAPPQGLGPIDLQAWVRSRQVQRGFQLANVRGGRFLQASDVQDVDRAVGSGKTERYRRYRFSLDIRGEVAGTYEFDPAALEGKLVAAENRKFVWRDAFARSVPLRLEVLEPPLEGRPASFGGAVGKFAFEMEPPSPTMVRVGDAVYVTLVAKGAGFLKGVGLDLGAQLGDEFRVERVGVTDSLPPGAERPPGFPDRLGQWRQWDFKVYPMSERVNALPAIAFSWFDVARRAYATASTAAVPITVRATGADDSNVVVAGRSNERANDVELVPTAALSANVSDLNLLTDPAPRAWLWFAMLLALPLVYLILSWSVHRSRRLRDDPALVRRRRAAARAADRLRTAQRETGAEVITHAHAALRGYVADLTNRDADALTSEDLLLWLSESGADPELEGQVRELCEAVEAETYGGGGDHRDRAPQLVAGLERVLTKARPRPAPKVPVWLVAALCISGASAQDTELLNQALAAFEQRDFAAAAAHYERVLHDGHENGHVLYNLGNAHLRSGHLGKAIAAYRRATLYLPGDANLEVNLRRALEARSTPLSPPETRTILDYVLFWRPHLPCGDELQLAFLAGILAFGLAVVRLFAGRAMPAVQWAVALLAVAALSLATSAALDYRQLASRDRAVVTRDGAVLRTGPGESFDARYEQRLGEGAELEVQNAREGWLKVLAGGKYEGWLPAAQVARW